MRLKKHPKIIVKTINKGFQKDIKATFDFNDGMIPKAQDIVSLGGATKKWIEFAKWKKKPEMTRKDGETFIKAWKNGYVCYEGSKRRWYKSTIKKHLLNEMIDNLEAIDLLRENDLL
ncbi:MAG: hypothetical protein V3U54_07685 [Thermodesulfobacteriota bacterium]